MVNEAALAGLSTLFLEAAKVRVSGEQIKCVVKERNHVLHISHLFLSFSLTRGGVSPDSFCVANDYLIPIQERFC